VEPLVVVPLSVPVPASVDVVPLVVSVVVPEDDPLSVSPGVGSSSAGHPAIDPATTTHAIVLMQDKRMAAILGDEGSAVHGASSSSRNGLVGVAAEPLEPELMALTKWVRHIGACGGTTDDDHDDFPL
jgi:hypothetical protein